MGIMALNASEGSIQSKAKTAYKTAINTIETLIKEQETIIKAKNMEIEAEKERIKLLKNLIPKIQKNAFVTNAYTRSYNEINADIETINENIKRLETLIYEKEALIKELDTIQKYRIDKTSTPEQVEIIKININTGKKIHIAEIIQHKAEIVYLKEQIKELNALIDLKREIDKQ